MVMLIAKRVPSIEQAVLSRLWVAGGGVLLDHDLPGCRYVCMLWMNESPPPPATGGWMDGRSHPPRLNRAHRVVV